jgi:phosphatidylglycerol:prolipoprotein diacylglycerol transferase
MLGEGFAFTAKNTFTIFGLTLYWYGAIIAVGFLLAFLYSNRYRRHVGLGGDDFYDYLIAAVPSAIVFARLYYVAFNFSLYRGNLSDIFKLWNGGLAIYGGVIGAVLAALIVARVKRQPVTAILDVAAPGLLIGQAVGRWGNFVNREAFGAETEIFCRMGLTSEAGITYYVHPTFLYESLWNLLGLLIIHIYTKKKGRRYDGQVFAFYIAWYGFMRMLIEGLRTDSLMLFNTGLRVSQVLAGLTFAVALFILCYNGSREHPPEKLFVNRVRESESEETPESEEAAETTEESEPETPESEKAEETEEATETTEESETETTESETPEPEAPESETPHP